MDRHPGRELELVLRLEVLRRGEHEVHGADEGVHRFASPEKYIVRLRPSSSE